jgi:hypothetical protein
LNCLVALANLGSVVLLLGLLGFSIAKLSTAVRTMPLPILLASGSDSFPWGTSQGHANVTLPQLRRHVISFPLNPGIRFSNWREQGLALIELDQDGEMQAYSD